MTQMMCRDCKFDYISYTGLGVWCLMPLSTIFHLYRGGQFYWWRKPEYPEETTDLSQVTDSLDLIIMYRMHLVMSVVRTHNLIGTDCMGGKFNYHVITTMTTLIYYKSQQKHNKRNKMEINEYHVTVGIFPKSTNVG